MIFSTKAEYGVRLMVELGRQESDQPTSLKAISEAEGLPLSYLEHVVARLRKAGLVRVRQERSWNFYTLVAGRTAFHKRLLACLGTCFRDVPELTSDLARAREIRARGGCCPG